MRRLLLVVLTVAVTVGLAGAPASAQTKVRKDKIGDAPANVDIRSAKVQNNAENYAVTVRFQKVQRRHTSMSVTMVPGSVEDIDEDAPFFALVSTPVSGGRYSTYLLRFTDSDEDPRVACEGLTSRWKTGKRGYARIVLPQSCLGTSAGRMAALVASSDKQAVVGRAALREALRGDLGAFPADATSFISTRRG